MIKIFLDLFSRETWESVKLSKILEVTWVLWTVVCPCVLVTRVCLTLWDPTACSPPGSSVHRILQARILEWVTIAFSRGSSQPRDRTRISCISCIGRQILYHGATREAPYRDKSESEKSHGVDITREKEERNMPNKSQMENIHQKNYFANNSTDKHLSSEPKNFWWHLCNSELKEEIQNQRRCDEATERKNVSRKSARENVDEKKKKKVTPKTFLKNQFKNPESSEIKINIAE